GYPKSKIEDILTSLADKNLLRPEPGIAVESRQREWTPAGSREPRFRMLETIREYALERLAESGEAEEASRRHALYYLDLAERAEPELRGPRQAAWLERLESERGNLRAALRWAKTEGAVEVGLRIAGALGWFWFRRGMSEGRAWLDEMLSMTSTEYRVPSTESKP